MPARRRSMVEKIVRRFWACGLCGCEFETKQAAVACESGRVAEPSFEVDELFISSHSLRPVFVGWYRNDKTSRPVEEIPIYRLVGAALARTTGSNIRTLSHRLLYVLEDDAGLLRDASLVRMNTDFIRLTDEDKPKIVQALLYGAGRFPELPELADKITDELLRRAKSLGK
jgi:hypothetical protein